MNSLLRKWFIQSHKLVWPKKKLNYCNLRSNLLTKNFLHNYFENTKLLYPYAAMQSWKSFSIVHNPKELNSDVIVSTFIEQYIKDKEYLVKSDLLTQAALKYLEDALNQVISLEEERKDLEDLQNEDSDPEIKMLAKEDLKNLNGKITSFKDQIYSDLLNLQALSDIDEIYVEITAGVGGQEAMLFVQDLMGMYERYCIASGWNVDLVSNEATSIGGFRQGCFLVKGANCYTKLKFEGGIHRVQRVPKTESGGRIHTSTASVAILPVPSEISIHIGDKDIKIDAMRASGPGGQNVNKSMSAVRVTHLPSGLVVECQIGRSQEGNIKEALRKIRAKLYQSELDKRTSHVHFQKKLQEGTKARSEKIRTYNFLQDRVTDHRVGVTVHNMEDMLLGGRTLEKLVSELVFVGRQEKLIEVLGRNSKKD